MKLVTTEGMCVYSDEKLKSKPASKLTLLHPINWRRMKFHWRLITQENASVAQTVSQKT